jgi:putative tricarboxylic transport membrane protein
VRSFARKGDFWSGLVLAVLGAYIVMQARGWTYMAEDGPGPGFFPVWYGAAMLVLSLALVAGAVLKQAPAAGGPFQWPELARALGCWVAFAASMALMKVVGFAPAFALLTWFIIAVMARQPQRVALPIALGGAVLFHVLFAWALEVELPRGLFY